MRTTRGRWLWILGLSAGLASVAGAAVPKPIGGGGDPYLPLILDQGEGWTLLRATGYAVDDGGAYYSQTLFVSQGAAGAAALPVTAGLYDDLVADAAGDDTTFMLDETILRELALAEDQGRLTPYLQSIAEPEDPVETTWQPTKGGGDTLKPLFGRCKNKVVSKRKTFDLAQPITLWSQDFGGGFSGDLQLSGNAQGTATGEIQVELKRYAVFGACIPYGVKFDHARVYGNLQAAYGATLAGTVHYSMPPKEWEIAKPFLFSFDFFLGPVPVHIGFKLPIVAGLELSASVTGSVTYNGGQGVGGTFDYTCTLNGCSGGNTLVQTTSSQSQPWTAGISGRIQPSIYAQVGLRAYLYSEWFAYAQVGVRPYLYGDLWGYYGNNCGDADGDGTFETVDALTFDLDWDLRITAQAAAFGGQPKKWDLGGIGRRHLAFWDLLEVSDALGPVLVATSPVPAGTPQRYDAKMRPCWPYTEEMTYRLDWGDGTQVGLAGSPRSFVSAYRTWPTAGPRALALTAQRDAHGRVLDATTRRTIEVTASARRGMTWSKVGHDLATGTDKFNCDGCDPYVGDRLCSESHPILCLRTDGSANPGLPIGFYDGWIGGNVGLSAPVRGDQLGSPAGADALCVAAFGPGWTMAPFHHSLGGWGWSSRGNVPATDRFWVRIDNQPAHCWN